MKQARVFVRVRVQVRVHIPSLHMNRVRGPLVLYLCASGVMRLHAQAFRMHILCWCYL
jgi:hypothetical protein